MPEFEVDETWDYVPTNEGQMRSFVAHPNSGGPHPAVILFMDIWGVREELCGIARRIAEQGYFAILPNLYYRQGDVANVFWDDNGRMISLHKLDEEREKIVHEQRSKLSTEMILSDVGALIDFVDNQDDARSGPIGSIGWCMGGWIGLKTAGEFPDRFQATATLHASRPISDQPDSPHLLIDKMRGGLYCGWAELDHLSPPDMVQMLESALKTSAIDYRANMHSNVEHGYALPDRDIFAEKESDTDWQQIFDLYRQYLQR